MLAPVLASFLSIFAPILGHAVTQQAAGAGGAAAQVAPSLPAPSPVDIVKGVQATYQNTKKLQANFRQRYTNVTFGKTSTSDGELYVETPGKMRWDYKKPDVTLYISDGVTLWVYEPRNRQAFKQTLEGTLLPVAVTFLMGQGNLLNDFTPSVGPASYGGRGDLVVTLTPKQPTAQYKQLHLVVDPTFFLVKESIIIEASGNENRFTFTDVAQNAAAKKVSTPKLFKFVPPKGTRVIEAPDGARPPKPVKPGTPPGPAQGGKPAQ